MENYYDMKQESQGSILRGLLGALIGAILGAIVWGVVGILTQSVFTLVGILLGFLVAKGYELLKGREGAAKIVIVILCVILAVVLGEAIYNVGMIHKTYLEAVETYGAANVITEREAFDQYIQDEAFWSDVFKNLAQALLFAAIGAAVVIIDMGKKKQTVAAPAAAVESPDTSVSNDANITPDA